jgi:hypothetical protein
MLPSIPASQFANAIPGVLSAGGNELSLNSVYLTSNPTIPIGGVTPFSSYDDVAAYFGASSAEAILAQVYFAGYSGCTALPETLYFAQFNTAAVAGYDLGADVSTLTITQLQALSDTGFTVLIDGRTVTTAAINLSSATSFSNAASLVQTGLQFAGGLFTGTASQAAGVVTISTTASGFLAVGDTLTGTGVEADSVITTFGTYTTTAGTGTVNVSTSGTVASGTALVASSATVVFNSQIGGFQIVSPTTGATSAVGYPSADSLTTGLGLTAAAGAVLSPGAAATTPAGVMNTVTAATQNFATYMTVSEQTLSNKEAFAIWNNGQNNQYLYVPQDSSAAVLTANASSTFGAIALAAGYSGCLPVYDTTGGSIAAFVTAIAASINFDTENGSTDFMYRSQAGLVAQVTDTTSYNNMKGNGYSSYIAVATRNQRFTYFANSAVTGPFKWADAYLEQIQLNAEFQLSLMTLQTGSNGLPYAPRGYTDIRETLASDIQAALNFGTIVPGVQLSGSQIATLISLTGDPNAGNTVQNVGWYLQVLDPGSVVRGEGGSPNINFWYTDGGKIQQITMSSTDVQ